MTHVFNTTYVFCMQIKWYHRGCDRLQASPDTGMCLPSKDLLKAQIMSRWQMSNILSAPPSSYLLCALHPSGPRWCCSGHSEISPAATHNPHPNRPMMPWWIEKHNARLKGVATVSKVTSIKWWSRFNVAGPLQLQLLVPDKEHCWGNPLRAQHHASFRCRS